MCPGILAAENSELTISLQLTFSVPCHCDMMWYCHVTWLGWMKIWQWITAAQLSAPENHCVFTPVLAPMSRSLFSRSSKHRGVGSLRSSSWEVVFCIYLSPLGCTGLGGNSTTTYLLNGFQDNWVIVEEIGIYVQLASKLYEYFSHTVGWAPFL